MTTNGGKSKKRLVLIDGHALLHRAYHAMPELTTSKGERVEAVYGFLRMLLKVVADLKPTHLAVALDRPEPTFRHGIYEAYQAQRPPTEEPFKEQRERLRGLMEAMEIPVYEEAGFEADDLLGTLAKQAVREGGEVIIVTGDRDILQLVRGEAVRVYMPKRGLSHPTLWDEKAFVDRYGFKPEVLVEYKALVGDASDNYPGVAGWVRKRPENSWTDTRRWSRSTAALTRSMREIEKSLFKAEIMPL
jgi:DNA polymerase-1